MKPYSKTSPLDYRKDIDGLRAIAVLPVIFFHAGFESFRGGFVGVDIFFVISGYLITSLIIKDIEAGSFSFKGFYQRRARRILPALYLVLLCTLIPAWLFMLPNDLRNFSQSLVSTTFFGSNFLFWIEDGYFERVSELKPLLHTWSLAIEEQFYIFYPLILIFISKLQRSLVFPVVIILFFLSLGVSQWTSAYAAYDSFFLTHARAWELLLGAICSFLVLKMGVRSGEKNFKNSNVLSFLGFFLILSSFTIIDHKTPFPSIYALLPTFGTALIILFSSKDTIIGKVLSWPALVGLGLISYSLYLWHQPIFAFARIRMLDAPGTLHYYAFIALSVFLAYLSWRYIEEPFRRKKHVPSRIFVSLTLILTFVFLAYGFYGHISQGALSRFASVEVIEKSSLGNDPSYRCRVTFNDENIPQPCITGNGKTKVALIGDSHAGVLVKPLGEKLGQSGLSVANYSYSSCQPVHPMHLKNFQISHACKTILEYIFSGKADLPKVVIISAYWASFINKQGRSIADNPLYRKSGLSPSASNQGELIFGINQTIDFLLEQGKTIILIYSLPSFEWDIIDRLNKHIVFNNNIPDMLAIPHQDFIDDTIHINKALDSIREHKRLLRFKPEKVFCDVIATDQCVGAIGRKPYFYDSHHLSIHGTSLLVEELMPVLMPILME